MTTSSFKIRVVDHESYIMMATYLLFFSTYHPVPVASVIDTKINCNFSKCGSGKNIAFWNWTPTQLDLLLSMIERVIMVSHWSTGKTRIIIEKALILARNGENVLVVLHYSANIDDLSDNAPILLYYLLANEIQQEKEHVQAKITLLVTNDIEKDVIGLIQPDTNIFIDEFVINNAKDMELLDKITSLIDNESYLWISVARRSNDLDQSFKDWLKRKKTDEGCVIPTFLYALRNSKEIIDFEHSLQKCAGKEQLISI